MTRLEQIQKLAKQEIKDSNITEDNIREYKRKLTSIANMIERLHLQTYVEDSEKKNAGLSDIHYVKQETDKFDSEL